MDQTDMNTLAMGEEGNEENGLDVSNIMQNSQFYIDDSKISKKKKSRRQEELPSFIQDDNRKRKVKVNQNHQNISVIAKREQNDSVSFIKYA